MKQTLLFALILIGIQKTYGWSCKPSTKPTVIKSFTHSMSEDPHLSVGHSYEGEDRPTVLCGDRLLNIELIKKSKSIFGEVVVPHYEEKDKQKWIELFKYSKTLYRRTSVASCEEDKSSAKKAIIELLPGLNYLERNDYDDIEDFHEGLVEISRLENHEQLAGLLQDRWSGLHSRHYQGMVEKYWKCVDKICKQFCSNYPAGDCSDALQEKQCGKAP